MTPLEALKAGEKPEMLALIKKDEDAKKVLVAWTAVRPAPLRPTKPAQIEPGEPLSAIVAAVWAGLDRKAVPFEEMAILSGIPKNTVKIKWDQLRRAGLIYPDGTTSQQAMATVRGEVGAYLRGIGSGQK